MVRYLAKRLFSRAIALFIFLTLMFFVFQIIIPTDFTTQFAMTMNREAREQLAAELGIDQPVWVQYLNWLRLVLTGNLGASFYGYPVIEALKALLPYTLLLFLTGTLIAFTFGQWLGKVTAWQGAGFITTSATFGSIVLYTSFPPWLSFLLTYLLARRLNLFRRPFSDNPFDTMRREVWKDFAMSPQAVMMYMTLSFLAVWGLLLFFNWLLRRRWGRRLPFIIQLPVNSIPFCF